MFLATLAWLPACGDTIVLGTECPDSARACGEPPAPMPPVEPTDAAMDALPPPPPPTLDAGKDAAEPLPDVQIANANFERGGGLPGDLVLYEIVRDILNGVIQVVLPTSPVRANLPNWYACFPLTVNSVSTPIEPTDAGVPRISSGDYIEFTPNTLLAASPDFIPVRQELPAPLPAGETVHLLVDALSRSDGENNLYLEVLADYEKCGTASPSLGRSAVIPDSADWTPTCVTFEADQAYTHLLLKPSSEGSRPTSSMRFLLDTLRVVSSCP